MEDFQDFEPNRLSAAQAYSMVKGHRMAVGLITAATEMCERDGSSTRVDAVAGRAFRFAKSSRAEEWRASAKRVGYPNAPSADSMRVCLVTLAEMANLVPPAEAPEEVAV